MTISGLGTIWVTSVDRIDHAVDDDAWDRAMRQQDGRFEAVCGAEFHCAPMAVEPAQRCAACCRYLTARQSMTDLPARMRRSSPSLLVRIFRRRRSAAGHRAAGGRER
jgi:hypothetical protein